MVNSRMMEEITLQKLQKQEMEEYFPTDFIHTAHTDLIPKHDKKKDSITLPSRIYFRNPKVNLTFEKSINIKQHVNKIKKKLYDNFNKCRKIFDKIKHLFVIKNIFSKCKQKNKKGTYSI